MKIRIVKRRWIPQNKTAAYGVTIYELAIDTKNQFITLPVSALRDLIAWLRDHGRSKRLDMTDPMFNGGMALAIVAGDWITFSRDFGPRRRYCRLPSSEAERWADQIESATESPMYRLGLLAEAKARSLLQTNLARDRRGKVAMNDYLKRRQGNQCS